MTVDIACLGTPFLDISLLGLRELPAPGAEVFGTDLRTAPGGVAIIALVARRLGASVTIVSPIASDWIGRVLAEMLAQEDIGWEGPPAARGALSVALGAEVDRAMASFAPPSQMLAGSAVKIDAKVQVVDLDEIRGAPAGVPTYVVTGDLDTTGMVDLSSSRLREARALLLSQREAHQLTGERDPREALQQLAQRVRTVVLTLGAGGALAIEDGIEVHVPAPAVKVASTLGAGDSLAGAYVVGDLEEMPLRQRVQFAVTCASMVVRATSVLEGVPTRAMLEHELQRVQPDPGSHTREGRTA
jgi:sugar/nucleoside kinase (ribokinase family)